MIASTHLVKRDVDDFLFEASRRLLSSPLDYERALATVARLAVPSFADVCTVHMIDGEAAVMQLAFAGKLGDDAAHERPTPRPCTLSDARGPGHVIRTGTAELASDVAPAEAESLSLDGTHGSARGVRSYLSVPITADGEVAGALTFAHGTTSERRFTLNDLPIAEELGRRAGQALETARRFERERSAREGLMRLSALTAALAKPALRIDAVARMTVDGGCRVLGAKKGTFHLCDERETATLVAHQGLRESIAKDIARIPPDSALPIAAAIRSRATVWVERSTIFDGDPCVVAPLVGDDLEPVGALVFGFDEGRRFDETDRAFVDILALHSAHALARAALLQRERRYHERVRVLADAGELLAGTLDYDATVENVAHLAMPTLADFCWFDVVEEDGTIHRVPGAYEDPYALALLRTLDWPPPVTADMNVCALTTGRTGSHPQIDDAWLQAVAPSPEFLEVLRKLQLCSLVTAPLVTAGERLGALTVCYGASARHHTDGDVALVEELARRAAVALKNARLYRLSQEATRRAEAAARQAEDASRLKDEFLATVSHELRTPLSSILGWANLLRGPRADTTLVGKGLEVIERNARSQQRLIEDILDVSRIVTGKLRIDTEPVDFNALASDVLESVRPTAFAKDIELTFEAGTTPFRLAGDSVRLRQVLWNLLSNAVKFTAPGGCVWLELEQSGDRIVLRVRDTGRGIDPSFLPHVFERFRQADSSTTREHGGLGLGLSIVRHLTEIHGGTVDVASDGVGSGSTFTVTLPVRPFSAPILRTPSRESVETVPSSPVVQQHRRLEGLRVVVVEDEADSRDLIALLLATEGAVVHTTASAEVAVAAVREFGANVVLSDIGMPGLDGYWLAGELRQRFPQVPSIALTAYSTRDDIARAIAAGFDHHVAKPVDPEQLIHALTACRRRPSDPAPARRTSAA